MTELKKLSLFFSFIFLALALLYSANGLVLDIGDSWSAKSLINDIYGVKCTVLADISLVNFELSPDSQCPFCRLYNVSNNVVLDTVSAVDNVCTFNYLLSENDIVRFVEFPNATNCNGSQNDATPNFPRENAHLNCTTGTYSLNDGSSWTDNSGYIWTISNATTILGSTPTLNINTNLINNTLNYNENQINISYNGTYSNTGDLFNCSLSDNNTIINMSLDVNLSYNNFWFVNVEGLEKIAKYKIDCNNSDVSDSTIEYYYYIDNVIPILNSDFINNTIFTQLDTINFYINGTDLNAFAYNISLKDENLDVLENYFAENLTVTFWENETSRIATDIGTFYFYADFWDSHNPTNKPVKNLTWYFNESNLFVEDMQIYGHIKNDSKLTYFYLSENKYKFKVTFNEDSLNHVLYIKSNKWRFVNKTFYKYENWLVNLEKQRYFDFYSSNIDYYTISYENGIYIVNITLKEISDEIEFESIGNLNHVLKIWSYTVQSASNLSNAILLDIYEVLQMIPYTLLFMFAIILFLLNYYRLKYIIVDIITTIIFTFIAISSSDFWFHRINFVMVIINIFTMPHTINKTKNTDKKENKAKFKTLEEI